MGGDTFYIIEDGRVISKDDIGDAKKTIEKWNTEVCIGEILTRVDTIIAQGVDVALCYFSAKVGELTIGVIPVEEELFLGDEGDFIKPN